MFRSCWRMFFKHGLYTYRPSNPVKSQISLILSFLSPNICSVFIKNQIKAITFSCIYVHTMSACRNQQMNKSWNCSADVKMWYIFCKRLYNVKRKARINSLIGSQFHLSKTLCNFKCYNVTDTFSGHLYGQHSLDGD